MTASPSISYSQTITYTSGSTRNGTVSVTKWEVSGTDNSYGTLNTSNGNVVWKANPQVTSDRSETIKVTVTGEGSKTNYTTATSTCKADSVKSVEAVVLSTNTSSCHWYYSPGSSSSPIAAAGGTASPVGNGACKFTFVSGSTATQSSAGTYYGGTLSFSRTYSGSATGFTVNATTGVVTASNNTTSTQKRSVSVTSKLTVTWGSKTDDLSQSRDCYQAAGTTYYRIGSITATSTSLAATYDGYESVYVTMQKTVSGSTPNTSNTWSDITGTEAKNIWGTNAPFYLNDNQAGSYDSSSFLIHGSITLLNNSSGNYRPTSDGAAVANPSLSAAAKWRMEFTWHNNDTGSSRKNTILALREQGNYGHTGEGKNYITFTQEAAAVIPAYIYGCNDTGTDIHHDFEGTISINYGYPDDYGYGGTTKSVSYQSSGGVSLNYQSAGMMRQICNVAFGVPKVNDRIGSITVKTSGDISNTLYSGSYQGCKVYVEFYNGSYYLGRSTSQQISSNYDPLRNHGTYGVTKTFDVSNINPYDGGITVDNVTEIRICYLFENY